MDNWLDQIDPAGNCVNDAQKARAIQRIDCTIALVHFEPAKINKIQIENLCNSMVLWRRTTIRNAQTGWANLAQPIEKTNHE